MEHPAFQAGQDLGDAASVVWGVKEMADALAIEGAGVLLDTTGAGLPAGLALNAAGVVVLVHGGLSKG
jgi:hypothetical protein